MSTIGQNDLTSMDYSYLGQPFVWVSAHSSIDVLSMDYSYLGLPFVTNPSSGVPNIIKSVNTVPYGSIKKFWGTVKGGIKKLASVSTTIFLMFISLSGISQITYIVCGSDSLQVNAKVVTVYVQLYGEDHGLTDSYKVLIQNFPPLKPGLQLTFKANTKNTGAAKLKVNDFLYYPLVKKINSPLVTGDILSGQQCIVIFDIDKWILINANL